MPEPLVHIRLLTSDGEEREEPWPTVDAFLRWARAEGVTGQWTAYEEDDDGDQLVIAKGQLR